MYSCVEGVFERRPKNKRSIHVFLIFSVSTVEKRRETLGLDVHVKRQEKKNLKRLLKSPFIVL